MMGRCFPPHHSLNLVDRGEDPQIIGAHQVSDIQLYNQENGTVDLSCGKQLMAVRVRRAFLTSLCNNTGSARLQVRKMATQPAFTAPLKSKTNPDTTVPRFVYGTAWKKDQTANLVYQALKAGFRAIDTAAQPRHYNEAFVGEGIARAIQGNITKRENLYVCPAPFPSLKMILIPQIQTKYTPPSGQDAKNMPYSASQPLEEQVHTSLASSLSHFTFPGLGEPYIDCLVLHSPLPTLLETQRAWKVFESYVPHKIRTLGISNTSLPVLKSLNTEMSIKPSVVQNRFYPATNFEVVLRQYCREEGIIFQSFWTLTGNPQLMKSRVVKEVAGELEKLGLGDEKAVALYSLVVGLEGITVLNGTTNRERMESDLRSLGIVGGLVEGEWKEKWKGWTDEFRELIEEL
jgi:diketogulonate reductase-like aldo/keto reductase